MATEQFLELKNLYKYFDDVKAVDDISISINAGELVSFIGPSGCGKTTLLRIIGGFHDQDHGEIILDGERVDTLPPEKRATGMVFQNYALFPHMTVYNNVAYGLKQKKIKKNRHELIMNALEQVELEGYADRKPGELSGGQQQRVAIARCLVLEPKVLLLDEPLSNLDANLRMVLREEIRKIKDKLNLTVIFVTHDQEEALSISDRIAVLKDGSIQQLDKPDVIYNYPKNEFVSTFVGNANFLTGSISREENKTFFDTDIIRFPVDDAVKVNKNEQFTVLIRPEQITINKESPIQGTLTNVVYNGNFARYFISIGEQEVMVDEFNPRDAKQYQKGDQIGLELPKNPHFIDPSK
ncbi:ABC transporter ATP-binding protein [Virgibacillus oceani]